MKIKNNLAMILLAMCLIGCESRETARMVTQANFLNPEFVGEIRGNKLYACEIKRANKHSHWVYFFDNNPAVTVNRTVYQGKFSENEVQMIFDNNSQSNCLPR